MQFNSLEEYQAYVKKKLEALVPIFAKASIGDFSDNVEISDEEDEFTQLNAGIQIMLEVIRENMRELQKLNSALQEKVDLLQEEVKHRELIADALQTKSNDLETSSRSLEAEKTKIETILTSIGDGVFAVDTDCRIILTNTVAQQLSGFTHQESEGKHYREIFKFAYEKETNEPYPDFVLDVVQTGNPRGLANHTVLVQKNGTTIAVSDKAAPLKDPNGQIFGAVVVFRDASLERELEKTKDEFISIAAHQLRTPLGIVRWSTEMLLGEHANELPPAVAEKLQYVQASNDRMIALVNNLLSVSRIEQRRVLNEPRPTRISDIVMTVIREIEPEAKRKSVTIVQQLEDVPELHIDPRRFHEVVQNILSNAVKYATLGGTVDVTIKRTDQTVQLRVEDAGIGIPPAEQDRIFTKFFRATNAQQSQTEGSGLGLFIVKSYADVWGGKVWIESPRHDSIGKEGPPGTAVYLELPLSLGEKL